MYCTKYFQATLLHTLLHDAATHDHRAASSSNLILLQRSHRSLEHETVRREGAYVHIDKRGNCTRGLGKASEEVESGSLWAVYKEDIKKGIYAGG